ncbi:MAG: carbohydrate binding family 9 domain-containing protein [Myxococcota bacterium]|nr:carbohydrate binding family 9 domain-containing protein [Myxococcota bacterium]
MDSEVVGVTNKFRALGLILFSLGLVAQSAGAEEPRPSVTIVWSETAPEIDGRLDDPVWEKAALIDQFSQVTPVPGAEPSQKTDVRIMTDGEFIYFGVRCHDTDPQAIVANLMLRDAMAWYDDRIVIAIDTFNDHRNGYAFEVNPRGSRHDVLVEGDAYNGDWQTLWFAEATIDSGGWSVEVAIPYHSLNFNPDSDIWGFNFSRGIRRNDEQIRWTDTDPTRFASDFGVAGSIVGMRGIDQGLGLSIAPSTTFARIDERVEGVPPENKVEPSLDVFYNLYPSVVASVTTNSGFAETEVDDRQVSLSRFALFFPEKRAFFLQDALIFDYANFGDKYARKNGNPFDSRRIGLTPAGDVVDVLAGGKVTGRVGNLKFGFMDVVLDEHEGVGRQNVAVGRVALNVLEESSVGAIFTSGSPDGGADNAVAGLDFNYRNSDFNGGQTLNGQAWFTQSFTGGLKGNESSFGALVEYPNDRTNWKVGAVEIQENFNPAIGFVNRVGIRRYDGSYRNRLRWGGYVRTLDTKVSGYMVTDMDNEIRSAQFNFLPIKISSDIGDSIAVAYRHDYEHLDQCFIVDPGSDGIYSGDCSKDPTGDDIVIPPGSYPVDRGYVRVQTSRNRQLQGAIQVTSGGFFGGTSTSIAPEITWRPNFHWLFEVDYVFNDVSLPQGDFKTHLVRARINYQFTPNLAWITVGQWDNVTDTAGINSRIHWIIEDGRDLFIVFNQGLNTRDGITATRSEPLIKFEWTFRF